MQVARVGQLQHDVQVVAFLEGGVIADDVFVGESLEQGHFLATVLLGLLVLEQVHLQESF